MWGGSSDTNDLYVVTSMIRARDQLRALAHAHHVVGRAVWDLVRETSATFVLHAMGKRCRLPGQEQQQQRDWGPAEQVYLCVRVSRVLGSAMGDVEGRVAPTAGSLCYWVDDRALLNMEEGRGEGEADCWAMDGGYCSRPGCWYICDGVTGARIGRVAEDPVGFSGLCEAVNGKWLVRCGDQPVPGGGGDDDGTNREVVMLTVRLNVLIQQSVLEYGEVLFREGRGVTTTVTLPQYVSDLKFMPSRPDHLLMAVFRTRETAPSFLIIDVEGTHTSGTLRLLSVTHCLIDLTGFPSLSSVFAMRRNDGSVYFITELGPHSFEVEETTGVARKLPCRSYCPLSDSQYFCDEERSQGDWNVPVWDCNNKITKPMKFVKMPTSSKTREDGDEYCWKPQVSGALGFLFHTEPAKCCTTIFEGNFPQVITLALSFPLWNILTLSVVSSV